MLDIKQKQGKLGAMATTVIVNPESSEWDNDCTENLW